jgi:hypothetical protein
MYLPDPSSIDFVAAVMVANRMPDNDPVWGMVIGPSGGGKTEAVQSAGSLSEAHQLSSLTAKTLLSGKQRPAGRPPASLLHRMKTAEESVLVLKDFTTILSMRSEERAEILSQLREVYDGRLDRETGMGDVLHWEGRVGFLAGVTPVIDQHHAVMALLGERFVYLRLPDTDAEAIGGAAFDENAETAMRAGLATAMREFVEETPIEEVPEASAEIRAAIVLMARRTAWVRSPVHRDSYGDRAILQRPSLEAPTRIVKQLRQLWRAAVLMGHEDPLGFAGMVARDSVRPTDRMDALEFIASRGVASSTEMRRHLELPYTTSKRIREDLEALGLIELVEEGADGRPNTYAIAEAAVDLFRGHPAQNLYLGGREEKIEGGVRVGQGFFGGLLPDDGSSP